MFGSAVTWMRVPSASGATPAIGWLRTRRSSFLDQRQRMAARGAAGTARARQDERALRAPGDVGKGRVGPGQLVGAVEHERPQPVRVADREGLGGV